MVKGVKQKKYSKRTFCLSCYAKYAGKLNARCAAEPKGMPGLIQLESGHCDECNQQF